MEKYSLVIIGATYAGLGIASCCENVLVLEEAQILGSDYHLTFRPVSDTCTLHSSNTIKLYSFMQEHKIVTNNSIDILRMSTALCNYAIKENWDKKIIFNAQLTQCVQTENGYEITYFSNTGLHTVLTKDVVDTTSLRSTAKEFAEINVKYLHVICDEVTDVANEIFKNNNLTVNNGFLPTEKTVTFEFAPSTSLASARLELENKWNKMFPNGEVLIDAISFDFDTVAVPKSGEVPLWIPPHSSDNPFTAFDVGCSLAEQKGW